MTPAEITGLFWELVGHDPATFSRLPGYRSGPTIATILYEVVCEMVEDARPVQCRAQGTVTLSTVTGAGPYDLPSGLLDFLDVEEPLTLNGIELRQILRTQALQMAAGYTTSNATPGYWYEMGRKVTSTFTRQIGFWPPPSAAGTVYVPYLREPNDFTTTAGVSYPDLPRAFHAAPAFGAAAKFGLRHPELIDPNKAAAWMNEYQGQKARLVAQVRERLRATMHNTVPDYTTPAWEDAMEV